LRGVFHKKETSEPVTLQPKEPEKKMKKMKHLHRKKKQTSGKKPREPAKRSVATRQATKRFSCNVAS
jgi:hypothetical protein